MRGKNHTAQGGFFLEKNTFFLYFTIRHLAAAWFTRNTEAHTKTLF